MKYAILILFIVCSVISQAQPNLYVPSSQSTLGILQILETGNRIFYSSFNDDTANGVASRNYYLTCVDKYNGTLIRTNKILSDTAFNLFEQFQSTAIAYCISNDRKSIHLFTVTDKDSSSANPSDFLKYPKTVFYQRLDTGLNIIVGAKPILHFNKRQLYAYYSIGLSEQTQAHQVTVCYTVRDTFVITGANANAIADKVLTVDDTGNMVSDKFIGYEPKPIGQLFYDHASFGKLYKTPHNNYSVLTYFDDSVFANQRYYLFLLDSNLSVKDTFYQPHYIDFGASVPGKKRSELEANKIDLMYLPTGSLIRYSLGFYQDSSGSNAIYSYYAVAKGMAATRYIPTKLYFPPQSDTDDYAHNSNYGMPAANYNSHDNYIYAFSSTKSNASSFNYCVNGLGNAGQIICIDTNLTEKWVKYMFPNPGYCIQSLAVTKPDGRKGTLISGRAFNLAAPNNRGFWKPFIYYVDSATRLSTNDPELPISISSPFTLYPNPARNLVTIENITGDQYKYAIVNAIGQVIKTGATDTRKNEVDVSLLGSGAYLLTITTNSGKKFSLKFFIV